MQRRTLFLFGLAIILSVKSITAQTVEHTTIIWTHFTENFKLSEKWTGSLGFQHRNFIDRDQNYHLYFSGTASYTLNNGFYIGAGFVNLNINQFVDTEFVLVPELRPIQFIGLNVPIGDSKFDWRFLAEERFQRLASQGELIDEYGFTYRLRNRVQYKFPVSEGLNVLLGSEIFLNAGKQSINPFDQHRAMVLALFKVGSINLSTGYMNWLVQTPVGGMDSRHTWMIGANHTIDWSN